MLKTVKKLFGTKDLYKILGLTCEEANDPKKLRNAYLRAALAYHPDKAPDDKSATEKFQVISQIYEIFKDDEAKKLYDQTGEWPDNEKFDLEGYQFGRLDEETVLKFKQEYIGSDAEKEDLKKFYLEGKGSLIHIFDNLFFANVIDDEERIRGMIESLIEAEEVERFKEPKGYAQKWKRYVSSAKQEAKEADEMLAEIRLKDGPSRGGGSKNAGSGSLESMILQRAEKRGKSFLDQLEAKYGGGDDGPKEKKRRKVSKK